MIRKWHGCFLDGEDTGGEEEVDGAGQAHGLVEDHLATYRHGRGLAGYLVEVLAGGCLDGPGGLDGGIHTIIPTGHTIPTMAGLHGIIHHTRRVGDTPCHTGGTGL